jgi:plasmid stability protein
MTIEDVPEDLVAALQQRAARNGRSLDEELLAIMSEAAQATLAARGSQSDLQSHLQLMDDLVRSLRPRPSNPSDDGR